MLTNEMYLNDSKLGLTRDEENPIINITKKDESGNTYLTEVEENTQIAEQRSGSEDLTPVNVVTSNPYFK